MTQIEIKAIVNRKNLYTALLHGHKGKVNSKLLVTVLIDEKLFELHIGDKILRLNAETIGKGKVSIPFILLKSYATDTRKNELELIFRENEIECGNSIFKHDSIIIVGKTLNPEINIDGIAFLKACLFKPKSKIVEMNLTDEMHAAFLNFRRNIKAAQKILNEYNINYDDLYEFVVRKINDSGSE